MDSPESVSRPTIPAIGQTEAMREIARSMASAVVAHVDEATEYVRGRFEGFAPRVGLVLGSGLGAFGDSLSNLRKVPYAELPHMPPSKVIGHAGNLCAGTAGGVPVVCMQGRAHFYEGHPIASVVHGVRTMARLGVHTVLLTNAAGGLVAEWAAGDLMVITDHLNLTGASPLIGVNEDAFGPRFPDMTTAYDPDVRRALLDAGKRLGIPLREGVYAWLTGPSYETPAEVRMVRGFGAHAVGMSTVPEVIALRHMGVRTGALSCVTNLAAGISPHELNHKEVEEIARSKRDALLSLLGAWIVAVDALPPPRPREAAL